MTFSKQPRIFMPDGNKLRFSRTGEDREIQQQPGPAHYQPVFPQQFRSTKQFSMSKLDRDIANRVDGRTLEHLFSVPGPASYSPKTETWASRNVPTSKGSRSMYLKSMWADDATDDEGTPGPGSYDPPPMTTTKRHKLPRADRSLESKVDGISLPSLQDCPAPTSYDPSPPTTSPKYAFSRNPRHINIIRPHTCHMHDYEPELNPPGPGSYKAPTGTTPTRSLQGGIIPHSPRQLQFLAGGVDLREQKKRPGPATYTPSYPTLGGKGKSQWAL
eukprot:TRINITY_DN67240_c15_g1_i1.p1 TRINITY_DN67240_c15_g1~~TRINITY_DN67240_c15_g1_i1.p1  ORF type:complete len:273 (+),score=1.97 TRINITY_DN67240_c15_g1_i1:53-871(+)